MTDFNVGKYKKCLDTENIGRNIIYVKEIGSTNDFALKLINHKKRNFPDGTVVLAEIQKKGRGRFERKWISPAGGLWFTIILKTTLEQKKLPEVTLIAAYSIASVLNTEYNIKAVIKWPNDIYHKRLKLSGILAEVERINNDVFLIIGIGINVNLNMKDLAPFGKKSTSIKTTLGKDIERELLLPKILFYFEKNYNYYTRTKDFKTIFKKIGNLLN